MSAVCSCNLGKLWEHHRCLAFKHATGNGPWLSFQVHVPLIKACWANADLRLELSSEGLSLKGGPNAHWVDGWMDGCKINLIDCAALKKVYLSVMSEVYELYRPTLYHSLMS